MSKKRQKLIMITAVCMLTAGLAVLALFFRGNTDTKSEKSAEVTLADGSTIVKGGGVTVDGDKITITNPGTYTFSGSLSDGRIIIDVAEGTVQVTLNGVDLTSSDRDVIYSKDGADVVITAADGTENTLTSGDEDFTADEDDLDDDGSYKNKQKAVIYTKGNLSITGTGAINITGNIYNGVQTKGTLTLEDASITVNAIQHGFKAKYGMELISGTYDVTSGEDGFNCELDTTISDGAYTIAAGDDGIHTDGTLTVNNGTITVTKSEEGLEGHIVTINDGDINITSSDDGINANGGNASGFGMGGSMGQPGQDKDDNFDPQNKPERPEQSTDDAGNTVDAAAESNDSDSATDAASMKDNRPQPPQGGNGEAPSDMPQMPDGTEEGEAPSDMPQMDEEKDKSSDNDSDSLVDSTTTPELTINGGTIYINAEGDGLDSNGNITINGGTVYVDGPSNGGNSAIDYGMENGGIFVINGGTLTAVGMSDMLEAVDGSSEQTSIMYVFSQKVSKGTEVTVTDSNGATVFTYTPVKNADSVILSSPDLVAGATYTFTYGEQSESFTISDVNAE